MIGSLRIVGVGELFRVLDVDQQRRVAIALLRPPLRGAAVQAFEQGLPAFESGQRIMLEHLALGETPYRTALLHLRFEVRDGRFDGSMQLGGGTGFAQELENGTLVDRGYCRAGVLVARQ